MRHFCRLFYFSCLISLSFFSISKSSAAETVTLATTGQAQIPIIVSKDASDSVKHSAAELADTLGRITGAKFEIQVGDGTHGIVVGTNVQFPSLAQGVPFKPADVLALEDYLIRTSPGRLALIGVSDLATNHAVWDLLYRVGYRQYFPPKEWEIVPHKPDLSFSCDSFEHPDYASRFIGRNLWPDLKEQGDSWQEKNRLLSWPSPDDVFFLIANHSYEAIISEFQAQFDADPTLAAHLEGLHPIKLNAGNPKLRALVVQHAINYFKTYPKRAMISMEPSDGNRWGSTPEELAIGSITDRALSLANLVAQTVNQRFGDKYVGMLAYNQHSPAPTKVAIDPHVLIVFATGFITNGLTVDQNIDAWKKAGLHKFAIYEYYDVYAWYRDDFARSRGARLDYLASTLTDFHKQGAVALDAEAGDAWGPNGFGYYFASRALWHVSEIAHQDEMLDEFIANCFPDAKPEMTRLYRVFLNPPKDQRQPDDADTYGQMYRLLKAARAKAKDENEMTRLDSLVLYVHYLTILQRFMIADHPPGTQAIYEEWLRFTYRIRKTEIVDSYGQWTDPNTRSWSKVVMPKEADAFNNIPADKPGGNPWKSEVPYTRPEIDAMLEEGIAQNPLRGFATVVYSHNLVPATRIPSIKDLAATMKPAPVTFSWIDPAIVYTWVDDPTHPVTFSAQSSSTAKIPVDKPTLFELFNGQDDEDETQPDDTPDITKGGDTPLFGAPEAKTEIPSDKVLHPVSLPVPQPGLYKLKMGNDAITAEMTWPPSQPLTLDVSNFNKFEPHLHARFRAFFYVPRGTKIIGGISHGLGSIHDPSGKLAYTLPLHREPGFFSIPVPEGMDGQCWTFEALPGGTDYWGVIIPLTVPPYLAPSPSQLFLPAEVVNADSKTN